MPRVDHRAGATAGRVIALVFLLLAVLVLVQVALGEADMLAGASAVGTIAIFLWWGHLWGWRGDPPETARNRLPWQR